MAELYQQRAKFFESGCLSKVCRSARCVGASVVSGEFLEVIKMPNSFSNGRIERLKREAKLLCRNSHITHSEALDNIAKNHGYGNWSLLMKHTEAIDVAPSMRKEVVPMPPDLVFSRTYDEMREALKTVPYNRFGPDPDEVAHSKVDDICLAFVSAANGVDFAIAYIESLLALPRFRINSGSKVYHEMRRWLPYHVQPIDDGLCILLNRHYKPVGMTASEWVDYNRFPNLQLQLDAHSLKKFAHEGSSLGYLFNDGCKPWNGRKVAKAYLGRLQTLKSLLNPEEGTSG